MARRKSLHENLSDEFFARVGEAITNWADIDEQLFHTCHRIIGTTMERASIIYYRTPSLEARLNLTNDLMITALPRRARKSGGHVHESVVKWKKLSNDVHRALQIRNQLAHSPVTFAVDLGVVGDPRAKMDAWYSSYISFAEMLRGTNKTELRIKDINEHLRAVSDLNKRLKQFRELVLGAQPDESAHQENPFTVE
jgi:hypothetical protein